LKIRDYKTNRTNLTRHRSGDVPGDLGREELLQTGSPSVGADCGARAVDLHHFRLLRRRAEGRVDVHRLQVGVVQEHFVGASKNRLHFQSYLIRLELQKFGYIFCLT
jgi:hypothetical protein